MKRFIVRSAVALAAALALGTLAACNSLGNPAVRQTPVAPRVFDAPDPGVLVTGGRTYLFGTTNNMRLPVREITSYNASLADSQTAWARSPHNAMSARPAWFDPGEAELWAPSPVKIGTRYYVYFAGHNRYATTDEQNDLCIGRASSTSAMGDYVPESMPVYCGLPAEGAIAGQPPSNSFGRGALDPEVVTAPDGNRYLLMALSRTKNNIGVVRLDSTGRVIGGTNATPAILASQQFPWHDGSDDSTFGAGAFLENPSMVYDAKSRSYLLFYSAGQWYSSRYNTGFGRCTSPMGPCTLDSRGPFLVGGNGRSGTGGLTAFKDATGNLRVAYTSWTQGHEGEIGSVGQYSRQLSWAQLVTIGGDPDTQTVRLG